MHACQDWRDKADIGTEADIPWSLVVRCLSGICVLLEISGDESRYT